LSHLEVDHVDDWNKDDAQVMELLSYALRRDDDDRSVGAWSLLLEWTGQGVREAG
jgi:hypothetical protein